MIDESQMTLAVDLRGPHSLAGWFASEKIFDCRVMWDGEAFWTRHGNRVAAPKWFTKGLPRCRIDGGIYAGRDGFQLASNATRFGGHWFGDGPVEFVAFDMPEIGGTWDKRITEAAKALKGSAVGRAIEWFRLGSKPADLVAFMRKIHALRGEGACFRNPDLTTYETGRSKNLLRWKFKPDED